MILYSGNGLGEITYNTNYGKSKPCFLLDSKKVKIRSQNVFEIYLDHLKVDRSHILISSCVNFFLKSLILSLSIFNFLRDHTCRIRNHSNKKTFYLTMALLFKIVRLSNRKHSALFFVLSPSKSDFKYAFKNMDQFSEFMNELPSFLPHAFNIYTYTCFSKICLNKFLYRI